MTDPLAMCTAAFCRTTIDKSFEVGDQHLGPSLSTDRVVDEGRNSSRRVQSLEVILEVENCLERLPLIWSHLSKNLRMKTKQFENNPEIYLIYLEQ